MGCGTSAAMRRHNQLMTTAVDTSVTPAKNRVFETVINRETMQEYLDIEQAISDCEKKQALHDLHLKREQLQQTESLVNHLQVLRSQFVNEANKLKRKIGLNENINSVNDMITLIKRSPTANEQRDYLLETINKQEIIERELQTSIRTINVLNSDIEKLSKEVDELRSLYTRRDNILDSIFEGQYGSELENKLERELDWLNEQKHQVDVANFRWKRSQIHTKEACRLLIDAIKTWKIIVDIPESDIEERYLCALEVRNKLVESIQNLQVSQNFLSNIRFPYCNADEVQTLEKAISYIFTDMQSKDRIDHALKCYETTLKRTAALRQWLEQVLNSTIARDLYEISEDCKLKAGELKAERIRLIRQRMKESTGKDIDSIGETSLEMRGLLSTRQRLESKAYLMHTDSGVDSELEESLPDEQLTRLFDSRDGRRTNTLTPDPTKTPFYYPTPLPSADLAPLPSSELIFGKIEEVRNRHKQEILELQRIQKMNQLRMMQGLRAKLAERRHRRSRLEMHTRELHALSETP